MLGSRRVGSCRGEARRRSSEPSEQAKSLFRKWQVLSTPGSEFEGWRLEAEQPAALEASERSFQNCGVFRGLARGQRGNKP